MKAAIVSITEEIGEPDEFFEIEVADREIVFYWQEKGGVDAVERLLSYVGRISGAL